MLIPKQRIMTIDVDKKKYCMSVYMVYDTDECGFVENRTFSTYNTKEDCQEDIDFFNSLNVIKAS